ncbi:MAG: GreA/GreB family elongation factor [Candidatus Bipolaricaulota bacterium]|nr:GreA/GreB family elongation factor [Candidatus Bipolaricaulota bacterium]MBS3792335.1 GreA/GreB family elongation factor [Candidatus Bipolaricaulota bacterium]
MATKEEKETFFLTEEGHEAKVEKLKKLRHELYEELPEKLKEAKAHEGDLRENKEFMFLREKQDRLQAEVKRLENLLDKAEIIDQSDIRSDMVSIGTKVILQPKEGNGSETYTLVSPAEVDLEKNKISVDSPIGEALMGHHQGEEIVAETPGGKERYRILGIGE